MTAVAAFIVFATARGVFVTPDAGLHVRRIAPAPAHVAFVDDVAWVDAAHIWYVVWSVDTVRARLYRTADGGRTWRSREVASHGAHAGARDTIQFRDAHNGWLTVQEPTAPFATLYATHDGGATWHVVAALPEVAPVVFQTATIAWLGGGNNAPYLYRSSDAGRHWRRLRLPPGLYGAPQFAGGRVLVPLLRRRSFSVLDGKRSSPPLALPGQAPRRCPAAPLSLAARSRTAWWTAAGRWVFRTRDGGAHWARTSAPAAPGGCLTPTVAFAGRALLLTEGTRQFASRDGAHWTPLRSVP